MTHINPDDVEFIRTHAVYFEQARLDFLHGLQPHVRNQFEMIYKAYIDRNFVLTTWCSACVVDMMRRLDTWWTLHSVQQIINSGLDYTPLTDVIMEAINETNETPQPEPKRGRGRPRKS